MLTSLSGFIKDHDDRPTIGHSVGANSTNMNTRDLVVINTGNSNISLGTIRTSNPYNIIASNHTIGTTVYKAFLAAFADAAGGDIAGDVRLFNRVVIIIGTVPHVHLVDVAFVCPFVVGALLEDLLRIVSHKVHRVSSMHSRQFWQVLFQGLGNRLVNTLGRSRGWCSRWWRLDGALGLGGIGEEVEAFFMVLKMIMVRDR